MVSFHRSSSAVTDAPEQDAVEQVPLPPPAPVAYPRVNLMPEVVVAEAKEHRAKLVLVGATTAAVLIVGGLYASAHYSVNSAQDNLDAVTAESAALNTEVARYADVPKIRAQVATSQQQLSQALSAEVRWSGLLSDLSAGMPANVSLTSFKGLVGEQLASAGSSGSSGSGNSQFVGALGHTGIGSISYEGEAYGYTDVAAFIQRQSLQNKLTDPFVKSVAVNDNSATGGAQSTPQGVKFQSTASITDKALTHRYDTPAGG